VHQNSVEALLVAVGGGAEGSRQDIYRLARRLLRLRLLACGWCSAPIVLCQ
jgi:hypothetical protein